MCKSALIVPFLLLALPAQETKQEPKKTTTPLEPRHFLVTDCQGMVFADLKQLRDRDLWEELQRSAIGMALGPLEKEGGFPLADLDRAWIQARIPGDGNTRQPQQMFILEGNTGLGLPESVTRNDRYERTEIGGVIVHARSFGTRQELVAVPRPELRVEGSRELIEPVLLGERRDGLPSPDVQSLLSGRGDNVLYMIFETRNPVLREQILGRLFGQVEWPEDDTPTHLMARVRIVGDKDDPHLEVEALLRHPLGKAGLDASEGAVKGWIESLQEHPRLGALKSLWKSLEVRRDGSDIVLRKDLGRTRDAVGTLALLLSPLLQQR